MGTDKALLATDGEPIAALMARRLGEVASPVVLVGDPAKYSELGWTVIPDGRADNGPLAGIEAALRHLTGAWALVLGCDMPRIPVTFLAQLAARAEQTGALAVVPEPIPGGLEPLCAAYHRNCLPHVSQALDDGRRKVKALLETLPIERVTTADRTWFQNLNTPGDWQHYRATLVEP